MTNLKITKDGILINSVLLRWGTKREIIRKKLNISFKEDERITEYRPDFTLEVCRDMFDDFS